MSYWTTVKVAWQHGERRHVRIVTVEILQGDSLGRSSKLITIYDAIIYRWTWNFANTHLVCVLITGLQNMHKLIHFCLETEVPHNAPSTRIIQPAWQQILHKSRNWGKLGKESPDQFCKVALPTSVSTGKLLREFGDHSEGTHPYNAITLRGISYSAMHHDSGTNKTKNENKHIRVYIYIYI
jgi:hypothetical protein